MTKEHKSLTQWWNSSSPTKRKAVIGLAAIEVVLTSVALRDLKHRPAGSVRGPKSLWFLASFVQPIGPVIYLKFGRVPATRD